MRPIIENLTTMIGAALDDQADGDTLRFEVSYLSMLQLVNPQAVPPDTYMLAIIMPSPILGQDIQMTAIIQKGSAATPDDIKGIVRQALEGMRAERSKQLNESAPVAEMPTNVSPGGIVLP